MIEAIVKQCEALFGVIPLSVMQVWGRFGYIVGLCLMLAAFLGFTFRPGGDWLLGRERVTWDAKAFLSYLLTSSLIPVCGFLGSQVVLVAGAQTFESLKDLVVYVGILLFGFPALVAIPPAYMLSDLIEGTPPAYLLDWSLGYFINPACFWIAYQLIGRDPDFRKVRTWGGHLLAMALFLLIEPPLWGYICSKQYTPAISFRAITPALFFTTFVTWALAPFVMLAALPLARKHGWFWAELPGRVKERILGSKAWIWESGRPLGEAPMGVTQQGVSVRMLIAVPVIALMLVSVGAISYLTLRGGDEAVTALASRLHREMAVTLNMSLDDFLDQRQNLHTPINAATTGALLRSMSIAKTGRIFIVDRAGRLVATSRETGAATGGLAIASDDRVTREAERALVATVGDLRRCRAATQFSFDVVTAKPLSRETWLAQATPYLGKIPGIDWLVVTATPERDFVGSLQAASSQTAMLVAGALFASLLLALLLASAVTAPIRRISSSVQAMAHGDLAQRVPSSPLSELDTLSDSFNHLTGQLQESFRQLKASEADLRAHRDHLEDLVAERTAELLDALGQAQLANRSKSMFLSMMSHELRTPLNAILGFSGLMQHDPATTPEQAENLAIIIKSGDYLLRLINNILDMSKIEAGQVRLDVTAFDLRETVQDVTAMMRVHAEEKGLSLRLEESEALPCYVAADEAKLRQVLINLLGNAIKFTEAGGVVLRVGLRSGGSVPGLVIEVQDSGVGLRPEEYATIFEPFVQVGSGPPRGGSGLGLAITRQFVEMMGGGISVESTWGEGSTFRVEMPVVLAERADATSRRGEVVGIAPGQPEYRCLIVEDQPESALLLRRLLERVGVKAEVVETGAEAVEAFEHDKPDLIWMDRRMPEMDGLEATRRIRSLPGGEAVKIVGCSASAFAEEHDELLAAGIDDFVRKPYRAAEIYDCMARLLGTRFLYGEAPGAAVTAATRSLDALAELPGALRRELEEAVHTLRGEVIEAVIQKVQAINAPLGESLAHHAGNYQFTAILTALASTASDPREPAS